MTRHAPCALLLSLVCACAPPTRSPVGVMDAGDVAPGRALAVDQVARVGGILLTREDVAARARRDGLSARAALDALEREALLLHAARERGLDRTPRVRQELRKASVRALLAELEREVSADSIGDAEVRARYEATRGRYAQPERRDVVHVVLPLTEHADPDDDARARQRAEAIARELAEANDAERERLLDRYEREPGLAVEPVPGVAPNTPFDESFIAAIFSVDAPGVVPAPARAYDGWHVVWVQAIHPAPDPSFEAHVEEIREELLARRRGQRLRAQLQRWRRRQRVVIDEAEVRRLLADIPVAP